MYKSALRNAPPPPPGTMFNWNHPLAKGCISCVVWNQGGGAGFDLISKKPLRAGTYSGFGWANGRASLTPGSATSGDVLTHPGVNSGDVTRPASAILQFTWGGRDSGSANITGLWSGNFGTVRLGDAGLVNDQLQMNNWGYTSATGFIKPGTPYTIGGAIRNPARKKLYLNGALLADTGYSFNAVGTTETFLVDGTRAGVVSLQRFAIWDRRELTQAEFAMDAANPYWMLAGFGTWPGVLPISRLTLLGSG